MHQIQLFSHRMKVDELPSKPILSGNLEQAKMFFTSPDIQRNIRKLNMRIQNDILVHLQCYIARNERKKTEPTKLEKFFSD